MPADLSLHWSQSSLLRIHGQRHRYAEGVGKKVWNAVKDTPDDTLQSVPSRSTASWRRTSWPLFKAPPGAIGATGRDGDGWVNNGCLRRVARAYDGERLDKTWLLPGATA